MVRFCGGHPDLASYRRFRIRELLLDEIPGIGLARKQALLSAFGSIRRLCQASAAEIAERVPGLGAKFAELVVASRLAMESAGGTVATFTMTAFDYGRHLVLCGTRGTLRGGDAVKAHSGHDIIVQLHAGDTIRYGVSLDVGGYEGHGGADPGLVQNLDRELAKPATAMRSGLHASVESHMMGYAAERSRRDGQAVDVRAFRQGIPALDAP